MGLVFFVCAVMFAGLMIVRGATENLIYSHETHLTDQGIEDCTLCHEMAQESTMSGEDLRPKREICGNCHDIEDTENCLKCHDRVPEMGEVATATHRVTFNHARHLGLEGVTCTQCHISPDQYAHFIWGEELMCTVCIDCHSGIPGPAYCTTCHGEEVYLSAPESHTEDFLTVSHGRRVQAGLDIDCMACHSQEQYCLDCHQSPEVVGRTANPTILGEPSAYEVDDPVVLPRIHEMNYRYTHPLDANAKMTECSICHVSLASCNECHLPLEDPGRNEPLSHLSPDWLGAAGGLHAESARQDIERCAACHEVAVGDPVCLRCHTSP